jgi:hypothetical protein
MTANTFDRTIWGTPLPIAADLVNNDQPATTLHHNSEYGVTGLMGEKARDYTLDIDESGMFLPQLDGFMEAMENNGVSRELQDKFLRSNLGSLVQENTWASETPILTPKVILQRFFALGDASFSFTNSAHRRRYLNYQEPNRLWQLSGEEITPLKLSIAVYEGIWNNTKNQRLAREWFMNMKHVSIKELAFAVARYPKVVAASLFDISIAVDFQYRIGSIREVVGGESYAWVAQFMGMGYLENRFARDNWYHAVGMTVEEWLQVLIDHGVDFDSTVPFMDRGIFDVEVISNSVQNGIDMDLLGSLTAGSHDA